VQRELAKFTQVVAYDHAGYWGSQPGPKPRDAHRISQELYTALRNANLPPPYVMVGYSFGGPFVRVFAHSHPQEIAGLVFVDPSQEECFEWLEIHHPEVNRISKEDLARQDEWGCSWASLNQARVAWPLPNVPVTLITCMRSDGNSLLQEVLPIWLDSHKAWLKKVPNAKHIVTEKSGHGIILEEPRLVIEAIREVVEQARRRWEK
jgi:pimeloyl-ACP methyl ester carboxylesterase